LDYQLNGKRFILDNIEYENEDKTFKFIASKRKARIDIDIPINKLQLPIPDNAVKINQ